MISQTQSPCNACRKGTKIKPGRMLTCKANKTIKTTKKINVKLDQILII